MDVIVVAYLSRSVEKFSLTAFPDVKGPPPGVGGQLHSQNQVDIPHGNST